MKHPVEETELSVTARAPFEVYYEGPALVVTATNSVGTFDILPGHADFFSILNPGEVIIEPATGEPIRFMLSNGIIAVQDNQVMLFANM